MWKRPFGQYWVGLSRWNLDENLMQEKISRSLLEIHWYRLGHCHWSCWGRLAGCHWHGSRSPPVTMFQIDIAHACMSASNSHSFETPYSRQRTFNLPFEKHFDLKTLWKTLWPQANNFFASLQIKRDFEIFAWSQTFSFRGGLGSLQR